MHRQIFIVDHPLIYLALNEFFGREAYGNVLFLRELGSSQYTSDVVA